MSDDELIAHEYAIENWESYEEGQSDYDALKQGVLYGLKAGRPEIHDLRKNPEDLPKEAGYILSPTLFWIKCLKGTSNMSYALGKYNFSEHEFEYAHLLGVEEVIAWCEVPEFTEVVGSLQT